MKDGTIVVAILFEKLKHVLHKRFNRPLFERLSLHEVREDVPYTLVSVDIVNQYIVDVVSKLRHRHGVGMFHFFDDFITDNVEAVLGQLIDIIDQDTRVQLFVVGDVLRFYVVKDGHHFFPCKIGLAHANGLLNT
jgi:hypothetical protein